MGTFSLIDSRVSPLPQTNLWGLSTKRFLLRIVRVMKRERLLLLDVSLALLFPLLRVAPARPESQEREQDDRNNEDTGARSKRLSHFRRHGTHRLRPGGGNRLRGCTAVTGKKGVDSLCRRSMIG